MSSRATGSFEVKMAPQGEGDTVEGIALARFSLNKQFHGELEAVSVGEMLSSGLESNGSAAYVAIERVVGTLKGRRGSFVLMHNGTMTRDSQHLTVTVVPESGTGALAGLSGTLSIKIVEKKHLYEFDYALPEGR